MQHFESQHHNPQTPPRSHVSATGHRTSPRDRRFSGTRSTCRRRRHSRRTVLHAAPASRRYGRDHLQRHVASPLSVRQLQEFEDLFQSRRLINPSPFTVMSMMTDAAGTGISSSSSISTGTNPLSPAATISCSYANALAPHESD